MLRHMRPLQRPPATLGLGNANQSRTRRSIPCLTCAGIFNRRVAKGEDVESASTSSSKQQQQQPPASSSSSSSSKTPPPTPASALPPAPVRSPPPTLSRRQERELRAAVARRERSAGPVVIEVRVEEGDTLESLARKTGLPAERIAAVAAEAAAGRGNGSVRGKGKGNAKGKEGKDEGEQQQQQLLVPGTALEFESPFEITPEVTAAVLRLEEIARSENLTREMADRQRDELVAALRERRDTCRRTTQETSRKLETYMVWGNVCF